MLILFSFIVYVGSLFAGYDTPPKVTVKRMQEVWPTDFTVEDEQEAEEIAKVETKFFESFREYNLYAEGKKFLARAKHSYHFACTLFTLETADKKPLGAIEEHKHFFNVYDEKHDLLATSSINFWETEIVLRSPDGHLLGTLSRPFFREHDAWSISVYDHTIWNLHRYLWLLLPAIHTDKAYWSRFPFYHTEHADAPLHFSRA